MQISFGNVKEGQEFIHDGAKWRRTDMTLSDDGGSGRAWELRGDLRYKEWSIGIHTLVWLLGD